MYIFFTLNVLSFIIALVSSFMHNSEFNILTVVYISKSLTEPIGNLFQTNSEADMNQ